MSVTSAPAFLYGLLFGSFANVCIHRMPIEESVVRRRSHCPHCDVLVRWFDNVPVISYLLLRGRCRACRAPISIQYPLIEIACGVLWLMAACRFEGADLFGAAALLWGLLVVFMTDIKFRIIPNEISIGLSIVGLLFAPLVTLLPESERLDPVNLFSGLSSPAAIAYLRSFAGLMVGGGIILAVRVLGAMAYKQEAMGMGDVKLMACVGAWLGVAGVLNALFVGILIGGGYSIFMLVTGRAGRRSYIPFGPSLAIGSAISLFESELISATFFPGLVV